MTLLSETVEQAISASSLQQKLSPHAGAVVALIGRDSLHVFPLGVAVDADTPMEIGSLTKVFTALLVAEAVRREELQLSTRIDDLLFEQPWPGKQAISVEQLAAHTSGLPRISLSKEEISLHPFDPYRTYSREQLLDYLGFHQPTTPDKPEFAYSNFGYAVLGLLLEKASSQTYEQLLQTRLLSPLGMTSTGLHLTGRPDRAKPGCRADGSSTSVWHFEGYAPCGAMVSTLTDLAAATRAFLDPENAVAPMLELTLQPRATLPGGHIGLAWINPTGSDCFWHNGATFGYTSYLGINRSSNAGLVILCNQFLAKEITELGHQLMRLIAQEPSTQEIQ